MEIVKCVRNDPRHLSVNVTGRDGTEWNGKLCVLDWFSCTTPDGQKRYRAVLPQKDTDGDLTRVIEVNESRWLKLKNLEFSGLALDQCGYFEMATNGDPAVLRCRLLVVPGETQVIPETQDPVRALKIENDRRSFALMRIIETLEACVPDADIDIDID